MYRFRIFLIAMVFCWSLSFSVVLGIDDTLKTFSLSNGARVELRCLKEGGFEWFESLDGFAVVRTLDRYEYAFPSEDGGIAASGVSAIREPKKLPFPPGLRPSPEFLRKKRVEAGGPSSPPSPNPISVALSDGTKLEIYLKGSGVYSWYEDKAGYSIVAVKGRMEYAVRGPTGELVGTGIEVDSMKPHDVGLTAGIRPSVDFLRNYNTIR